MKILMLLTPGIFFVMSCSFLKTKTKEEIMQSLDDSIKSVSTSKRIEVPEEFYGLALNVGPIKGDVKFMAYDGFVITPQAELKVPGNCYRYWLDKGNRLARIKSYYDSTETSGLQRYWFVE